MGEGTAGSADGTRDRPARRGARRQWEAATRRGRGEAIVEIGPGRLARLIARNRRRQPFRALAAAGMAYLSAYENEDWDIHHNGEARLIRAARRLWPQRFVALDVGSFEGEWAMLALGDNPDAEVHCFEVVDRLGDRLAATFADEPRVVVNRSGLWSHDGELDGCFTPEFRSMSSLVPAVREITGAAGAFRTRVETGDAYCERRHIDRINVMKIDVEGGETEVLRGFERCFARGAIDIVQLEYGPLTLAAGHRLKDQLDLFADHDMAVGKLYPTHIELVERYYPGLDDHRWANYVALRRDIADRLGDMVVVRS